MMAGGKSGNAIYARDLGDCCNSGGGLLISGAIAAAAWQKTAENHCPGAGLKLARFLHL